MFEKCSDKYHRLRSLMACYDGGAFRKLYDSIHKKHAGQCILKEKTSLSLQSRLPPIVCRERLIKLHHDFRATKLIAAMCGRREDLWMVVIPNDGPQVRMTRKNGGLGASGTIRRDTFTCTVHTYENGWYSINLQSMECSEELSRLTIVVPSSSIFESIGVLHQNN